MTKEYLDLPVVPADAAFGIMADFDADPHPNKVSLITGAYRDENGKPWVLPSVKKVLCTVHRAKIQLLNIHIGKGSSQRSYSRIFGHSGLANIPQTGQRTCIWKRRRQQSGTGANHLAATFLARHLRPTRVFIPKQTWVNHKSIWELAGVKIAEYPYFSPHTKQVDIVGMLEALEHAEPNDVVILQACAHNPTGVDLSKSQWMQVAEVVQQKKLFAVFDSAYQGFATGDIDGDAWAVRYFTESMSKTKRSTGICVAQSFSKNFGLYGERVGALHFIAPGNLSTQGVRGHLMALARAEYSNPPRFGASIVETVLGDKALRSQWETDLGTMSSRIQKMRGALRQELERETQKVWSYVETEIGMFSYTGLTKEQVSRLREDFHIYLLPSGRMSVCGLNEGNVKYVARAVGEVIKA